MYADVQTVEGLQEVLLNPDGLPLLIQYPVFGDPDQVFRPRPGLWLQGGVQARDALELLLFGPTQPHELLLRLHTQRQLPAWTGNRKEAVSW